ncbi:serine protease [Streptomyces sp. MA5143a]|uniref:serine protease n=1 Tax=Streptomyces sp. MA5143a TaxID=2083010 RepID=UPI000D27B976|nr:serine protease [Streptomyces sp. MA5143a]SPF05242.1 putative NTPase (NACHT family) [Streptomyces sp. MA5143a]
MIGGGALDRVVAVLGRGQGSGVLLGRRSVLTARHVVAGEGDLEVIHPSCAVPVKCRVVCADETFDVALLVAESDVISAERAAPLGSPRLGVVATDAPLPHCQIVGFPQNQRYGVRGEDLEYDQYRVSILPMAGRMRSVLVCELDAPGAKDREHRNSPLQGLSGAAVFAGSVLLGVVIQVPRGRDHWRIEAVAVEAAMNAMGLNFGPWEEITDVHPQDEHFEARYAADLSSQYRRTEIFGIDELGRSESRWDLDTAYLSLQAEAARATRQQGGPGSSHQRIDSLLSERPRALLRGEAGAGKTTLVWWLAAHAANGSLGADLAALNGLVPFVIPMREVHARGGHFPRVSELLSAGRIMTDDAPEGWARRVLEAGRGLLLVDGLDEVPEREREEARRWLTALLDRYPRTRCLATVRPNAVEKGWLAKDGFAELTLLPMTDDDIRAFVGAWHDAARLECEHLYDTGRGGDERHLLTTLEQELIHQLGQNAAIRDLARTPLLCAVICALHRRRRGLLPTTRWSLYRAALSMLLGGRDAGRGVRHSERVPLDSDEQHALLQRLAVWLVRTGQQQMTHGMAAQQLGQALRDMTHIREQSKPDDVLRFLLDRSGLLQERSNDAIQFIHRTFQDFLAAKEFHESGYVLELLRHAADEAWRDVIVLAVGHATRKDAHHIVERLVDSGDAAQERGQRWYFHLLAARCATSLLSLDAALMERVRERVGALMPLKSWREADELAGLGDWAVDLLPDPEVVPDFGEAHITVAALTRIRSAKARQALKGFAVHPSESIRSYIVDGWSRHPTDEYAREVLSGIRVHALTVEGRWQLPHLRRFASITNITLAGSYTAEELDAHLPTAGLKEILLFANHVVTHLHFLRQRSDLKNLALQSCPRVTDFSALRELSLEELSLNVNGLSVEEFREAGALPTLRALGLTGTPSGGWTVFEPHPGVRELTVDSPHEDWLARLDDWASLEGLKVLGGSGQGVSEILCAVSGVPRISSVGLNVRSLHELAASEPLPHVRRLELYGVVDSSGTASLCRVFPQLEGLTLHLRPSVETTDPVDLTALQSLPGLRLTLTGQIWEGTPIVGGEAFGDRLHRGYILLPK